MRVLMLTRRVDRADPRAGFTHRWIEALASHPRVDGVDVICLEMGEHRLPGNVTVASMGKERGYSRLRELAEFRRAILPAIRRADVVFVHMIPRYAIIAAPWARRFRVPVVLWYAHRQVHPELRLAHALASRIVTASPESFTLPSDKLTVIGHGIDMASFAPAPDPAADPLILAVGRLSAIKNYETLIEALAQLRERPGFEDARLAIAGGTTPEAPDYDARLRTLAERLGVAAHVDLPGAVPPGDIPALYHQAAVTANLAPTGGLDKVVIESLASGVPAVVHNRTFLPVLGSDADLLWCETLDAACVADRLAAVLSLPPAERAALGARLAARVREAYALEAFIDRLVGVFEDVTR